MFWLNYSFAVEQCGEISDTNRYSRSKLPISKPNIDGTREELLGYSVQLFANESREGAISELQRITIERILEDLVNEVARDSLGEVERSSIETRISRVRYVLENSKRFSSSVYEFAMLAAKQGSVDAQFCVSNIYYFGVGVPISSVNAHAWAYVAHAQASPLGRDALSMTGSELDINDKLEAILLGGELERKYTDLLERASFTIIK